MSESEPATTVYLIRHGATDANEQRPYILQGAGINHSLSETGQQQAKLLGDFLKNFHFDQIYSSGLKRAIETAQAVADHHDLHAEPIELLHECQVGRWEGMDWDSIMSQHPAEYAAFMENPADNAYLDGESYGDVFRRVKPVLDELFTKHLGQTIVVVAHNIVNRVLLADLTGIPLKDAKQIRQTNTGINILRYRESEGAELLTLNAHFHLAESWK